MSKYIDSDKLITEIKRRKKQDITFRERNILVDIETCIASLRAEMIIESLQQEQSSLPSNLNEAAEEWCKTNNKGIALSADKKSHYLAEGMDAYKA